MRSPSPRRRRRSISPHRSPARRQRRSPSPKHRRRPNSPPRRRRSRSFSPPHKFKPNFSPKRKSSISRSRERSIGRPKASFHRSDDKRESKASAVIQEAESTVSDERRSRKHSDISHGGRTGGQSVDKHGSYRDRSPLGESRKSQSRSRVVGSTSDPQTSRGGVPARKFDQTARSLHERFASFLINVFPFVPKENISVGIERSVTGNEEAVLDAFIPNQVMISRRRGEGEVALTQREEFLGPQDDDHSERRVISVEAKRVSPPRIIPESSAASLGGRENFSVSNRDRRWGGDWQDNAGAPARRRVDDDHRRATDRDDRQIVQRRGAEFFHGDPMEIVRSPNDLRHNLARLRDREDQPDIRQRIGHRRGNGRDTREGGFDNFRVQRTPGEEELPDFSQRPDKGMFEEWKQHPESIPKGSAYYEHDNREDSTTNSYERRGRGGFRGGFRGRGRGFRGDFQGGFRGGFRGGYRGGSRGGFRGGGQDGGRDDRYRDNYRPRREGDSNYAPNPRRDSQDERLGGGEWKHDKFAETEQQDSERPSSTT